MDKDVNTGLVLKCYEGIMKMREIDWLEKKLQQSWCKTYQDTFRVYLDEYSPPPKSELGHLGMAKR